MDIQDKKGWLDTALEHHEEGNYSQAILAITKYTKEHPSDRQGKLFEALIYGELANFDLALNILNEIEPTKNDSDRFLRFYFEVIANIYQDMGNFREALMWYDKLIELIPNETVSYILKGSCLAKSGKYQLAKIEHLKATKLKGDPEEAFYNLALLSRAEMNFEIARHYCEKSLEIDPHDESVLHCYRDILEAIKIEENQ